jgi:hypothetical protein
MTEPNSAFEELVKTLLESARFRYSPKLAAKHQAVLDAYAGVVAERDRAINERDAAEEALAELRADPNAELKAENEWLTHLMKRAGFNVLRG